MVGLAVLGVKGPNRNRSPNYEAAKSVTKSKLSVKREKVLGNLQGYKN